MKSVFIILFLFFVVSCETTFVPDLPDNGSGLVIYSFFRPDAPLKIDVFNTTPIMNPGRLSRKTDLTLRLTKNGILAEEISANAQGVYISREAPSTNDEYRLETMDGAVLLSATSHVPLAVPLVSAEISDELEDIDVGKYGYPAQISFNDPADSDNYYAFEVIVQHCASGCSGTTLDGAVNELLVEEVKVNTSGNADVNIGGGPERIDGLPYIYLNDDDFNGKTITLKFFVIPVEVDLDRNPNVVIKFVLKSITKAYYDYLRTSDFQIEAEDGNGFAEPVQVATNIRNGLGTFAGYNYSLYTITP